MTVLLVFCLLSCAILVKSKDFHFTEEQKKMAEMLHNSCAKESGVREDVWKAATEGDFKDDNKIKCYMKCLMVQTGVYDDETMSLDNEAMIEMLPDSIKGQSAEALKKCTPLIGDNACEQAFHLYKCFYEFDPER